MQLSQRCRSILNGSDTRLSARLVRLLLAMPAWCLYGPAVTLRNRLYDWHLLRSSALPVPVICVGNITVGGTGKTPLVIWLCRRLRRNGRRVVVLARAYKADTTGHNDETRLLCRELPDVPVVIDPDRLRGGRRAIDQYHPDVIVMDDGFQHRRLNRDLDIIAVDCTCPFGYDHLLPRGLLREAPGQLSRAHAVILTRSDQVEPDELARITRRIEHLLRTGLDTEPSPPTKPSPSKPLALSCHRPVALLGPDDSEFAPTALDGQRVYAFCGIANPSAFGTTLKQLGAEVINVHALADHIAYNSNLLRRLVRTAETCQADRLVTTEKDWVKIKDLPTTRQIANLYRLKIEAVITAGEQPLGELLDNLPGTTTAE